VGVYGVHRRRSLRDRTVKMSRGRRCVWRVLRTLRDVMQRDRRVGGRTSEVMWMTESGAWWRGAVTLWTSQGLWWLPKSAEN